MFLALFEKKLGKLRYITYVSLIQIVLSSIVLSVFSLLEVNDPDSQIAFSLTDIFLFAPIIETFLLQALPFSISRKLKFSTWGCILMMSLPFGLLHYSNGKCAILNAFLNGIIYSASFIIWEKRSYKDALLVTIMIHVFHNIGVVAVALLASYFST